MSQPHTKPFSGIFVSYRRDDSSGHAGRLFDRLVSHFGHDRIFMDIDTIEPGEDFVTVIEDAVGSCEILIAIIGRHWLSGRDGTPGWLDNPNDFVRLEIATALSRDIRVIPVLVQRATMPRVQNLPDDLAQLSRRNAVELDDLRWRHDVDQLISILEKILTNLEETRRRTAEEEEKRRLREAEGMLEESRRLDEVARQVGEQRQREEAEENRRAEEQTQRRLAEEEAARFAVEQQRARNEERERREATAREKRESEQVERMRGHELRVQAKAEAQGPKELDTEAQRIANEHEKQRRRVGGEALPRAGAKRHVEKQAGLQQNSKRKRTMRIVLTCVSILAVMALVWKWPITWNKVKSVSSAPARAPAIGSSAPAPSLPSSPATPQPPSGMVLVPGGEFTVGRISNDPLETPHRARVGPFFIGVYEVTCEDYKKFLDANPHQTAPPNWVNRKIPAGSARLPATGVDWDHASAYAAWANKRLPTEEEWEIAARGPEGHLYPWGNDWKPGLANTGKPDAGPDNGSSGLSEVGSFKEGKSPYGAYDMTGNAWEWTASKAKACPGGDSNSSLDRRHEMKVIRGGSWASENDQATATFRRCYGARGEERGYSYTGFRLAQDVPSDPTRH